MVTVRATYYSGGRKKELLPQLIVLSMPLRSLADLYLSCATLIPRLILYYPAM